ncbi:MAG TPA: hypothetical protein VML55_03245 [Planctomycetaceae bacterium]|nr:hypothetical protein [Planctomycetaceae bacterium]
MLVGRSCLRTAVRFIEGWSGNRECLAQAAELCWLAGFWFLVDWPEGLRERYGALYRRLIGPWTFRQAIEDLTEAEARELAGDLLRFAREALDEGAARPWSGVDA